MPKETYFFRKQSSRFGCKRWVCERKMVLEKRERWICEGKKVFRERKLLVAVMGEVSRS